MNKATYKIESKIWLKFQDLTNPGSQWVVFSTPVHPRSNYLLALRKNLIENKERKMK